MGKENQPGQQNKQPLLAKLALGFEGLAVKSTDKPPESSIEGATRREFLRMVVLVSIGVGIIAVGAYVVESEESKKYRVSVSPGIKRELKTGPNGEELFFWGPRGVYWQKTGTGIINYENLTRNLFLAFNHQPFEKFLRQEKVVLESIGSIGFLVMATNLTARLETRRARLFHTLLVNEDAELAGNTGEQLLIEKSRDISAEASAVFYISQERGNIFLASKDGQELLKREKERLLGKLDSREVPFLSLWRQPLK
ncbi:MAG: hypothetical protein Q8Q15_00425 [bacterium]|nr:hypothetical protein [bacterium]